MQDFQYLVSLFTRFRDEMLEESEDGEDHRANRDEDAAGEII